MADVRQDFGTSSTYAQGMASGTTSTPRISISSSASSTCLNLLDKVHLDKGLGRPDDSNAFYLAPLAASACHPGTAWLPPLSTFALQSTAATCTRLASEASRAALPSLSSDDLP